MSSLQDAMAKAGIISQKAADEADKKIVAKVNEPQENRQEHREQAPIHTVSRPGVFGIDGEDDDVILAKFDILFNNERSKKFMNHLIFAFTPFAIVQTLETWSPDRFKNKRCCICNALVVSRDELLQSVPQMANATIERLRSLATGAEPKSMQQIIQEIFHEPAYIGSQSPDSKSLFCPVCIRAFFHWIELQLLNGNRAVHAVISKKRLISSQTRSDHEAEQKSNYGS
jgi:hypothetical protein